MKQDDQGPDEWEVTGSSQQFYVKEKPVYNIQFSDVETMKERFAMLLLGEDNTGGHNGLSTALAMSNAITNLAASVFGELWKLQPLPEETKSKWRKEMDWLLSPTNYMVELVPAKQNDANGRIMEIMTPKARADIHLNLPALRKLDSMLIETLDSMVSPEFWYAEGGSWAEGMSRCTRQHRRRWIPLPQVPTTGLSEIGRKKLLNRSKVVHQIFKAAKSINENVLLEMPVPSVIKAALPKASKFLHFKALSGRASLGEELYTILSAESKSVEEMVNSLNLTSERSALETINRLEAAVFAWKDRITEKASGKSPVRTSWPFIKDPISGIGKMGDLLDQAEDLIQLLKIRYPNIPRTFLDVVKIQYGKDIGLSILEAYSQVLRNLASKILSRIGDILQEDVLSNPNPPSQSCCFPRMNLSGNSVYPVLGQSIRRSLIDQMNKVDEEFIDRKACSGVFSKFPLIRQCKF
ncbi:hypothetical protein U1Q18_021669 [Sarracenia purpurea var. burkii]